MNDRSPRTVPARLAAYVATVAPLGVGALVARALATRHPHALDVDFSQPLVVATAWHTYGALAFAILAASVAASAVLLLSVLRSDLTTIAARNGRDAETVARASGLELPSILVAAALGLACVAAWPFVFSSDVYAYAAYGHLALHGLDPYRPVAPWRHDAFLDAARWQWGGPVPVDVYGPVMVGLERVTVALTGDRDVGAALVGFRLTAALAFLGSVALAYAALREVAPRVRTVSVCAYALHPGVLWGVAEGHNDAVVLLVLGLGAVALARGRGAVGALLVGLTPLLKAPGAIFASLLVLDAGARALASTASRAADSAAGATLRHIAAVGAVGLAIAATLALVPLIPALAHVGRVGTYAPNVSLAGLAGPVVAAGAAALALALGCKRIANGARSGYAWIGIAAIAALPNPYPWYALWLVPLAVFGGVGPASAGLWVATIFAVARYLPDATGSPDAGEARLLAAVAVAPLALAFADVSFRRHQKKAPNRS